MGKKRYFDTRFWSDTWVVDELNQLDRYLFMYLLLNEKTNLAGVYELSLRTMSFETGIESRDLATMLKRLEPKAYYREGWVVLVNAIRHQNYTNSKIKEGIRKELCAAPAELLQIVRIPADADIDLSCHIQEVKMTHDESSMGHQGSSHLIESNLNRIESNSKPAVRKRTSALDRVATVEITELLEFWESTVGMKLGNEAGQRKAIAALLRQHGKEPLKKLVGGVVLALDDQYAPRISDFVSLKRKQNDLIVWGRKRQQKGSNVEVI